MCRFLYWLPLGHSDHAVYCVFDTESVVLVKVISITDADLLERVYQKSGVVLLEFSASWCVPCKKLAPIVHSIAENNPWLTVLVADIDAASDSALHFGIAAVPSVLIFKNGVLTYSASSNITRNWLESSLSNVKP